MMQNLKCMFYFLCNELPHVRLTLQNVLTKLIKAVSKELSSYGISGKTVCLKDISVEDGDGCSFSLALLSMFSLASIKVRLCGSKFRKYFELLPVPHPTSMISIS